MSDDERYETRDLPAADDAGSEDEAAQARDGAQRFEMNAPPVNTLRSRLNSAMMRTPGPDYDRAVDDADAAQPDYPAASDNPKSKIQLPKSEAPLPSFIPPSQPVSTPRPRPPMPPSNGQRGSIPRPAANGNRQSSSIPNLQSTVYNRQSGKRVQTQPKDGIAARLVSWLAVGVAVVLVLLMAGIAIFEQSYSDRIYPGVSVLGEDLSGLTMAQASERVNASLEQFVAKPVTLASAGKMWTPALASLGLSVDTEATVQAAYRYGRTGTLFSDLGAQWAAYQHGKLVPIPLSLDEAKLGSYLDGIGKEINQPLIEGDVQIVADGTVKVTNPQESHTLDNYATIGRIKSGFNTLESRRVDLVVNVNQPIVGAKETQQTKQQVEAMLSAPVVLQYADRTWGLDKPTLASWLKVTRVVDPQQPQHLVLSLDDSKLNDYTDKLASDINRPAQNARFAWDGDNGSLSVISESSEGLSLVTTDTLTLIRSTISTPANGAAQRTAQLPVVVATPEVSSKDIGKLGIKELIGRGVSTFKGSAPERATNIKVAAGYLNGAVIPPSANFSFLKTIGAITVERGYVEGYVIVAERTEKGVGGGVCQVSTTTFRAAFWSGVPIAERNQHAYRVSWYEADGSPVGFDAAVFEPNVDMQFVNDTGAYILVQAYADMDNETLTVSFYGSKPGGRDVQMDAKSGNRVAAPPDQYEINPSFAPGTKKQVEYAHQGIDATIIRNTTDASGPHSDTFFSRYTPWPNIYQVSADIAPPGTKVMDSTGN